MKSSVSGAATGDSTLRRLLDLEQMARTLAFLAGYRPAVFPAAPDEAGCEAPRLRLDGWMPREDGPEPYCSVCGGPAGIFLGHGADWHHFRAQGAGSRTGAAEVYVADHPPVIGWRYIASGPCGDSLGPHPGPPQLAISL